MYFKQGKSMDLLAMATPAVVDCLQSTLAFVELSDFEIILPDKSYKLHKVILNRCGYFRSLFSTTTKESLLNSVKFEYNSNVFDVFIDCIYSSPSDVDWDIKITGELFDLAIYFQHSALIKECIDSITSGNIDSYLFLDIIIKYEHIVPKLWKVISSDAKVISNDNVTISEDKFIDCCTRAKDVIFERVGTIPDTKLLTSIIQALNNIDFDYVIELITNWMDSHKVESSSLRDLADSICFGDFSISTDIFENVNNLFNSYRTKYTEFIDDLSLLFNKCIKHNLDFAFTVDKCIKFEISINKVSLSVKYNGKVHIKEKGSYLAIELKEQDKLPYNIDFKFKYDSGILTLGTNQDIDLTLYFVSEYGKLLSKRAAYDTEKLIKLNTNLFSKNFSLYLYGK